MSGVRDEIGREVLFGAAHAAIEAANAILRAARDDLPLEDDVLEQLADAARIVSQFEFDLDRNENGEVLEFHEATVRFLDGWSPS